MDPKILCVLFAVCTLTHATKLLRVTFSNTSEFDAFLTFYQKHAIDAWIIRKDSADVAVSESDEDLVKSNFKTEVLISDLNKKIEKSMAENERARKKVQRKRSGAAPTEYFAPFDEIITWLEKLARDFKSFVQVFSIGKTYEGRDMKILRIGTGPETKPAVFITSGIHAREWLTPATMIYTIDKIIKARLANDPRITKLIQKYDWYFSVVTNPDGYVYSFINRTTRLWRKTRSKLMDPISLAYGCIGVDPNRNFDVEFGEILVKFPRTNPCLSTYKGPYPFSEKITSNLRDFVLSCNMNGRIRLYYDVHAYSQLYLVPYSFDKKIKPPDDEEMRRVAKISNAALMKVNGRKYKLGTTGDFLYEFNGDIMDWFKIKAGVKYSYSFELFPVYEGHGHEIGFEARPKDIRPSGEEILEAILTAAENIQI